MTSTIDLQIYLEIKIISMRMYKNFSSRLRESGLTPSEAIVILKIFYDKNPVTPTDVAFFLNVARSRSSRIISSLLEKRLIKHLEVPKDKRQKRFILSTSGGELAKKLENFLKDEVDNHFNLLDEMQKIDLLQIFKRVNSY